MSSTSSCSVLPHTYVPLPAGGAALGLLAAPGKQAAQALPGSTGGAKQPVTAPEIQVRTKGLYPVQKFLGEPDHIPLIGFGQLFQKQRPVADARRHHDHIPPVEPVPVRTQQVLQVAAAAVQHLVKGMAVQLHHVPGVADVPVVVHIAGVHLHLLVQVFHPGAVPPQKLLHVAGAHRAAALLFKTLGAGSKIRKLHKKRHHSLYNIEIA